MKQLLNLASAGLVGFLVIFLMVLAGGQTFGQRCEKEHIKFSPTWHECVDELSGHSQPR